MLSLGLPPAIAKQRHRLVLFSPEQTNANGRYSCRAETLIDVTECEHNGEWMLSLQHVAAYGHDRYRTLQHMDFTADERDCNRTLQHLDFTADGRSITETNIKVISLRRLQLDANARKIAIF